MSRLVPYARITMALVALTCLFGCIHIDGPTPKELPQRWGKAMNHMGMIPVIPLREDLRVGDIFLVPASESKTLGELTVAQHLPMMPRWASINLLDDLDEEYKTRPDWPETPKVYLSPSPMMLGKSPATVKVQIEKEIANQGNSVEKAEAVAPVKPRSDKAPGGSSDATKTAGDSPKDGPDEGRTHMDAASDGAKDALKKGEGERSGTAEQADGGKTGEKLLGTDADHKETPRSSSGQPAAESDSDLAREEPARTRHTVTLPAMQHFLPEAKTKGNESIFDPDTTVQRLRSVNLAGVTVALDRKMLEAAVPSAMADLVLGSSSSDKTITMRAGSGEYYSISISKILRRLVERKGEEPTKANVKSDSAVAQPEPVAVEQSKVKPYQQFRIRSELLDTMDMPFELDEKHVWMFVVTKVIYVRHLDISVRSKETQRRGRRDRKSDPILESFARAQEINAIMMDSNAHSTPGGLVRFIRVADDAVAVRRLWNRGMVFAISGIALKVDRTTGDICDAEAIPIRKRN